MSVWSYTTKLRTKDVNLHRRLRTSRLLEMLQEASIAHTEELGWGREKTLDRGYLWMVVMQRLEIARMPEYDEVVRVSSWPGETMQVLYPRHYVLEDARGEAIVRASAFWTLVDTRTRQMASPQDHGVVIGGVVTGDEIELPKLVRTEECEKTDSLTVPFSLCDLNGHMNNTRYLDVVEDRLAGAAEGWEVSGLSIEYASELRFGDELSVRWRENARNAYVEGMRGQERCFRVRVEYR